MESMTRYVSPVNPAVSRLRLPSISSLTGLYCSIFQIYPHIAIILLLIGCSMSAWFFVFEVSRTKGQKDTVKGLFISLLSSVFLGFGIVFGFLASGIYVWSVMKISRTMRVKFFFCNESKFNTHFWINFLLVLHDLFLSIKVKRKVFQLCWFNLNFPVTLSASTRLNWKRILSVIFFTAASVSTSVSCFSIECTFKP